jgi:hypothetical protein
VLNEKTDRAEVHTSSIGSLMGSGPDPLRSGVLADQCNELKDLGVPPEYVVVVMLRVFAAGESGRRGTDQPATWEPRGLGAPGRADAGERARSPSWQYSSAHVPKPYTHGRSARTGARVKSSPGTAGSGHPSAHDLLPGVPLVRFKGLVSEPRPLGDYRCSQGRVTTFVRARRFRC